jgi:hypothetical protein
MMPIIDTWHHILSRILNNRAQACARCRKITASGSQTKATGRFEEEFGIAGSEAAGIGQ